MMSLFGIKLNLRYWLLVSSLMVNEGVWGNVCAKNVLHINTVFRIYNVNYCCFLSFFTHVITVFTVLTLYITFLLILSITSVYEAKVLSLFHEYYYSL